jgi:ribosome-binding factor A
MAVRGEAYMSMLTTTQIEPTTNTRFSKATFHMTQMAIIAKHTITMKVAPPTFFCKDKSITTQQEVEELPYVKRIQKQKIPLFLI